MNGYNKKLLIVSIFIITIMTMLLPKSVTAMWDIEYINLNTFGNGTGISFSNHTFSISPSYLLPQNCLTNQSIMWDGILWVCGNAGGNGTVFLNVTNNVTNNISNNITQNFTNNITTFVTTTIENNFTINLTNNVTENITNNFTNNISIENNITNNITQNFTNNISIENNITINLTNNITQNFTSNFSIENNVTNNITQNFTTINNITENITNNFFTNITNNITENFTNNVSIENNITNNISNNITQNFTSNIQGDGDFLYNDSSTMFFNSTKANETWYLKSNPQGFINQTLADTLYYAITNPSNFINQSNLSSYNRTTELQTLFYNISNPKNYINDSFGNATYYLKSNPSNFINQSNLSAYNRTIELQTLFYNISNPKNYINDSYGNATYYLKTNPQQFINATNVAFVNNSNNFTVSQTINGNLSVTENVSAQFYYGDGSHLTGLTNGNLLEFFLNDTSDLPNSKNMSTIFTRQFAIAIPIGAQSVDNITVLNWTTINNTPQLISLIDGSYHFHIHAVKTAGLKDARLQFELWRVNITGGEYEVLESEQSDLVTSANDSFDVHGILPNTTQINITDRLKVKMKERISGAGSNPDITVYVEGETSSGLELPTGSISIENFVPYTGAIKDVNLDGKNLFVNNLNASGKIFVQNFTVNDTLTTTRIFTGGQNISVDFGATAPDKYINYINGGAGNTHVVFEGAGTTDMTIDNVIARIAITTDTINTHDNDNMALNAFSTVGNTTITIENTNPGAYADLVIENRICAFAGSPCYSLPELNATGNPFNQVLNTTSVVTFQNVSVTNTGKITQLIVNKVGSSTLNSILYGDTFVEMDLNVSGNLNLMENGSKIVVANGTNACMGKNQLAGASRIQINTTCVTAKSSIFVQKQPPIGAPSQFGYVQAIKVGVSFNISSSGISADVDNVSWIIIDTT